MESCSEDELATAPASTIARSPVQPPPRQTYPEAHQIVVIQDNDDESQHFSPFRDLADPLPSHVTIDSISTGSISTISSVPNRKLVVPKSRYNGHIPPLPVHKEREAVSELLRGIRESSPHISRMKCSSDTKEFDQFELSNFTIYLPGNTRKHPYEMRGLQHLFSRNHSSLLFDGVLSVGHDRRYVEGVPFKICSIGNYGQEHHSVRSNVWIQSDLNDGSDIYYQLTSPSTEYMRFHEGFSWLADLAKHFVDYCQASSSPISVHAFRSDFSQWVRKSHQDSVAFEQWYGAYQNADFRLAVCQNIEFLFKESIGVDEKLRSHPIWNELLDLEFVEEYPMKETKTIVTPYVYDCFSHLKFGSHLRAVQPFQEVQFRQASHGRALPLTVADNSTPSHIEVPNIQGKSHSVGQSDSEAILDLAAASDGTKSIKVGDVVAVTKDAESVWKDEDSRWNVADTCWYLLIQEGYRHHSGKQSFHGIWLYRPSDTSCARMRYPFPNELFLSDNCTCRQARIHEEEVLHVVKVDWHGHPSTSSENLFIRQTYLENERFVTLREKHKTCAHLRSRNVSNLHETAMSEYSVGQTVLAVPSKQRKSKHELEVYEILSFMKDDEISSVPEDDNISSFSEDDEVLSLFEGDKDNSHGRVLLRQLQRRSEFDDKGRPNELVYTDIEEIVPEAKIYCKCLVRYFGEGEPVTAPYNRDGAGNAFYITQQRIDEENGDVKLAPLESSPESLIQGFDPSEVPSRAKLRGMDLYCGGGNFGRGLEEGGAIENCYAVDLDRAAIHTYNANLQPGSGTKLFFGSVDDLLQAAMGGNKENIDSVPLPGDIDFISAGSPCQGFSMLNIHKNNDKSLKNQSLVASVAAFVDFYRPRYGLLENVISMAKKGIGRDEDVLSQLVCALVGMGYQTQLILLDAWSSGSPQSRSRLFVSFAAPEMEPLEFPALSHAHPPNTNQRGLGMLANGESFGSRNLEVLAPFQCVTARESVKDLPVIGDGMTSHCTRFPYHVLEFIPTERARGQVHAIPLFPRGSSFAKAWKGGEGTMSKEDRCLFPTHLRANGMPRQNVQSISKGWERVHPNKLFGTVTVTMKMASARGTATLHWDENRIISLMEYRRVQSFPDDEILLGTRSQCMKIIGNSVARTVAVSLGLALREAWLKCRPDSVSLLEIRTGALPVVQSPSRIRTISRFRRAAIPDSAETSHDELSMEYTHKPSVPGRRQILVVIPAHSTNSTSGPNATREPVTVRNHSLKRPRSVEDTRASLGGSARVPRLS